MAAVASAYSFSDFSSPVGIDYYGKYEDFEPAEVGEPDYSVDNPPDVEKGMSEPDSDDNPPDVAGGKYIRHLYFPDDSTLGDQFGLDVDELSSTSDDDSDEKERLREGHRFDAINYLFSPSRDYLFRGTRKGSEQVEKLTASQCLKKKTHVIIFMFYIPVMKDDSVSSMCCNLRGIFSELAEEKQSLLDNIQVVLVVRMRPGFPNSQDNKVAEEAFYHFFSAFSPLFLAIPISDSEASLTLFEKAGPPFYSQPTCIVADLNKREVVCTNIYNILTYGLDFFPFTADKLLGRSDLYYTLCCGDMSLSTLLHLQSNDELDCVSCRSACGKKETLLSLTNKVVFLYFLCGGEMMDEVYALYKLCKDKQFEFELVVVRPKSYLVSTLPNASTWDEAADFVLREPTCCGWLHLPVTDRVSRRICYMYETRLEDQLLVVGPNTSYVELDVKEVYRNFGIGAYPFTKEAVWEAEVVRARGISLQKCLRDCCIHSLKLDGNNFPASELEDKYVVIYFGAISPTGKLVNSREDQLFKWVNEMEAAANGRFRMIFACFSQDVVKVDGFCCAKGWFRPVASDNDSSRVALPLVNLIYGKPGFRSGTLAAFGPKGQLLRLGLERSVLRGSDPVTFPITDDGLREDVGVWLNVFWEILSSQNGI